MNKTTISGRPLIRLVVAAFLIFCAISGVSVILYINRVESSIRRLESLGGERSVSAKDMIGQILPRGWDSYFPRSLRKTESVSVQDTTISRSLQSEIETFSDASYLGFYSCSGPDFDMQARAFPYLVAIICEHSKVSVASLPEAKSLEILAYRDSRVSIDDMRSLARYPRLKVLVLKHCRIDNECVQAIPELSIQKLDLEHTDISDTSLKNISQRQHLRKLILSENKISDDGVSMIQGCQHLEELDLNGTLVTDESLQTLRKLKI